MYYWKGNIGVLTSKEPETISTTEEVLPKKKKDIFDRQAHQNFIDNITLTSDVLEGLFHCTK